MNLQIGNEYGLRLPDGTVKYVKVTADAGGGWYRVNALQGPPDLLESYVNLNAVVEVTEKRRR